MSVPGERGTSSRAWVLAHAIPAEPKRSAGASATR